MPYYLSFDLSTLKDIEIPTDSLSNERALVVSKYVLLEDRQRSAIAWLLLQFGFKRFFNDSPSNYKLSERKNGKPYLIDCPYDFSISHSLNLVYVIIGDPSDGAVGVDIEFVDFNRELHHKLLKRFAIDLSVTNCEIKRSFFKEWTIHEAMVKLFDSETWEKKRYCRSSIFVFDNCHNEYALTVVCQNSQHFTAFSADYPVLFE